MEELIEKIYTLTDLQLQEVMRAIERRYASAYPDWNVVYLAMPRDQELRRQEYAKIIRFIGLDIEYHQQQKDIAAALQQARKDNIANVIPFRRFD